MNFLSSAIWKKLVGSFGIVLLAGALWSDGSLRADDGGAFLLAGPEEGASAADAMRIVDWDRPRGWLQVHRPGDERLSGLVVLTGVECADEMVCDMLERGRFERLIDHFRRQAKAGEDDALVRRGLAMNLFLSGDLHGAIRAYSWAAAGHPDDPHVRIGMGSVLGELGLAEQASKELAPLLRSGDFEAVAMVTLGNAQHAGEKLVEALSSYEQAVVLAPHLGAAHFNRGLALMETGRSAEAAGAFRQGSRSLQGFADTYLLEGLARLRSKDSIGAAVALHRAEELGIQSAALHLALGVACRDLNLDEQAVRHLRLSLDAGMVDERVYQLLAASLMRLGKSEKAAQVLEAGFALQPKSADAHFLHGLKLFLVEQPERAAEHMLEAVKLGKKDADVFFILGQALLQSGQAEAAIRSLQVASGMKPSSADILFSLGLALRFGQDIKGALREMKKAVSLAPDDVEIGQGLMETYAMVGDFAACANMGRRIVSLRPELLSVRFETAFCMALSGELDAASAHLEAAMDQDLEGEAVHALWRKLQNMSKNDSEHRLPGIHLLLAIIHQHRGNWSAATRSYERFLLGHPGDDWTRKAVSRIHSLSPAR